MLQKKENIVECRMENYNRIKDAWEDTTLREMNGMNTILGNLILRVAVTFNGFWCVFLVKYWVVNGAEISFGILR